MLIRYPGSKDRASNSLLHALPLTNRQICEPFAGTAAVSYEALRRGIVDEVWLNDADPFITDLHTTVRDDHQTLIELIAAYTPDVNDFYNWRPLPPSSNRTENAFRTIVLHQISFSGLGRKAGSPIGGANQEAPYKINCRWNPATLVNTIQHNHALLSHANITITCSDWTHCPPWAWYIDPPYLIAGDALYNTATVDHGKLAEHLKTKAEPWVLSYDDAPDIHALYDWAHIKGGLTTFLNHGGKRENYRKQELVITPRTHQPTAATDELDMIWETA